MPTYISVHEITAGHRSLSGTISCVTDRIRFLLVTMTGRVSNFNTVNPRISPRGLIVNFEILHGGLIEGGGLFEGGGLLKIIFLYMGAKSK